MTWRDAWGDDDFPASTKGGSPVLVVFVDGGLWWLINLSDRTLTDVEAYIREGTVACEIDAFRTEELAPNEQMRCEPLDLAAGDTNLAVEVSWTFDGERGTATFTIPADGQRTPSPSPT